MARRKSDNDADDRGGPSDHDADDRGRRPDSTKRRADPNRRKNYPGVLPSVRQVANATAGNMPRPYRSGPHHPGGTINSNPPGESHKYGPA